MRIQTFLAGGLLLLAAGFALAQDDGQQQATGTGTAVDITDIGDVEGGRSLVCWRVAGSGTVPHVAVHFDTESHAGSPSTFEDYDAGAGYPDNQTAADPAGYRLPGDFCTNVPVQDRELFVVAHFIDSRGGHGEMSDEERIVPQDAGMGAGSEGRTGATGEEGGQRTPAAGGVLLLAGLGAAALLVARRR